MPWPGEGVPTEGRQGEGELRRGEGFVSMIGRSSKCPKYQSSKCIPQPPPTLLQVRSFLEDGMVGCFAPGMLVCSRANPRCRACVAPASARQGAKVQAMWHQGPQRADCFEIRPSPEAPLPSCRLQDPPPPLGTKALASRSRRRG